MGLDRYISKQFSNPTGIGGKLVSGVMNKQNRPLYEETLRLLMPSDADNILDIGCGNGYVLSMLANRYDCISAGIDTSESTIKDARTRCSKYIKDGKMTFSCQDASSMSFNNDYFHKSYTVNTVYFWENPRNTMVEIGRILKPGGLFANTFYTAATLSGFSHTKYGYKQFSIDQLTEIGEDIGFDVNIISILDGSAYCVLYNKR